MTHTPRPVTPTVAPGSSAVEPGQQLPYGKRRPATGAAQQARQAWGREWGGINSELAKQRKEHAA